MKSYAYQHIKTAILGKIHSGQWRAGFAIPSEIALTQTFGVSRMTVNRALKELTNEKVLERRQGSGTFVAQAKFSHTFIEIRNIAKDITERGQTYRATVLDKKTYNFDDLPNHIAQLFFDKPSQIHWVMVVHFANELPLQLEERWVSADLLPNFMIEDFNQVNISDYLINTIPLERGHYQIVASLADRKVANVLQVAENAAVLVLERTTLSQGKVLPLLECRMQVNDTNSLGSYNNGAPGGN